MRLARESPMDRPKLIAGDGTIFFKQRELLVYKSVRVCLITGRVGTLTVSSRVPTITSLNSVFPLCLLTFSFTLLTMSASVTLWFQNPLFLCPSFLTWAIKDRVEGYTPDRSSCTGFSLVSTHVAQTSFLHFDSMGCTSSLMSPRRMRSLTEPV